MRNNPYVHNRVAKQLLEGYYTKILENEQVDSLLAKVCDNALNAFKTLTFDLAPKRDRNPDVIRLKLSDIASSKTVKSLTAKLIDYADDNDLADSRYAEAKRLYLESLHKFAEALDRASEISKSKDEVIFKQFKMSTTKLQNSIDNIAKQAEEDAKKLNDNEGFEYDDTINESIFTGYKRRVDNLKKLLTNLISSAEGKDQKSGYGRDWKRTFLELDEKRKALDNTEGGDKNRKILEEVEKQVDKFQEEFNNTMIQTANRSLQKLEDDEEVYTTYSDVTNLVNQALDLMTRAKTQYGIAVKVIKDENEVKEVETSKAIFPLKRGDKDTDRKIKGSGLIFAIQTALCDGLSAAGKLIRSKGGPNGKYGPATTSVISTIQRLSGNKNANGQIDQALLSDIIASDWVSDKNRKAINAALHMIGTKMHESTFNSGYVKSISELFPSVNEGKIVISNSDFEKELNAQYKIHSAVESPEKSNTPNEKSASGINGLAKKLRSEYNIKVESDDFVKQDGSLKASYNTEFIKDWNLALAEAKPAEEFSYFFSNGAVYNINIGSSSLKTPCNWNKWTEARQIKTLSSEDAIEFLRNYLKGWTTFGMIGPLSRYEGVKELLKKNSNNEDLDLSGPFEMMESSIKNKEIPFIDYDSLKGDITRAFNVALQKNDKNPDLNNEEFVAINNFLVMIANCVTFDGSKFISCIKWIDNNVLGAATAKRISKDSIFSSAKDDSDSGPLLTYEGSKIIVGEYDDIKKRRTTSKRQMSTSLEGIAILGDMKGSDSGIKNILGNNCYYIAADIYPSVATHIKRMNATSFDEVPQQSPFKCINVDKN
jgi:uncharacterized protein YihD (DUF1040 family)